MSLIRWRDAPKPATLQDEMNRLFEDFFSQPMLAPRALGDWAPPLSVKEDAEKVTVTAELPGIDGKDVAISVENDILTLKGEKREEKASDEDNHHYVERRYGSFLRRVRLPAGVNPDAAEAKMNKGVLTLHLPKTQPESAKKIDIDHQDG